MRFVFQVLFLAVVAGAAAAQSLEPTSRLCDVVFTRGIRNTTDIQTSAESAAEFQDRFCRAQFESYGQMRASAGSLNIPIPLAEGLLEIGASAKADASEFRQKRDAFCRETSRSLSSKITGSFNESMISTALLASFDSCVANYLKTWAATNAHGVAIHAIVQPDFEEFAVVIRDYHEGDSVEIRSILPSTVVCQLDGAPAIGKKTNSNNFQLGCKKSADVSSYVSIGTNHGPTNTVHIPAKPVAQSQVSMLSQQVSDLSAALTTVIPAAAVLAFRSSTCPAGWQEYTPTRGRVIVGSGAGAGLTPRNYGDSGGEERHTLTSTEMPRHAHPMGNGTTDTTAMTPRGVDRLVHLPPDTDPYTHGQPQSTGTTGDGAAHENMPPFTVLTYCERKP